MKPIFILYLKHIDRQFAKRQQLAIKECLGKEYHVLVVDTDEENHAQCFYDKDVTEIKIDELQEKLLHAIV